MHGLPNPQAQNHNAHVSEDTDRNSHPNVQMATVILRHALCSFPTDIHRSVSDGPNKNMQKNVCVYNQQCAMPVSPTRAPRGADACRLRRCEKEGLLCVWHDPLSFSWVRPPLRCRSSRGVAWLALLAVYDMTSKVHGIICGHCPRRGERQKSKFEFLFQKI
jgi:hypothetical protein